MRDIKFHGNQSSVRRSDACGNTGGHTDLRTEKTKPAGALRYHANAPGEREREKTHRHTHTHTTLHYVSLRSQFIIFIFLSVALQEAEGVSEHGVEENIWT